MTKSTESDLFAPELRNKVRTRFNQAKKIQLMALAEFIKYVDNPSLVSQQLAYEMTVLTLKINKNAHAINNLPTKTLLVIVKIKIKALIKLKIYEPQKLWIFRLSKCENLVPV